MKTVMIAIVSAAAMFSGAAFADSMQNTDTAATATPAVATTADVANPVICKMTYHEGMVIPAQRTCLTKQQWDFVRFDNQKTVRDYQTRSLLQFNR